MTAWTTAVQASLSFAISQSLPKLMSIELVMPSNHLMLCCPLLLLSSIFPSIRSFPISWVFASGVTRQRYYIIIDYIPHTVHFIQVTHLFCNWKFLPLYFLPFSLIFPPLSSPLATTCLFSLSKFGIILKEFTSYTVLFSYMFLFTT